MSESTASPPIIPNDPLQWVRSNLFSSWFNSLVTIACVFVIYKAANSFLTWALTTAQWQVLSANLRLFMVGRYPTAQYWRIWLIFMLLTFMAGLSWGVWGRFQRIMAIAIGALGVALATLLPSDLNAKAGILLASGLVFAGFGIGQLLKNRIRGIGLWVSGAWLLSFPLTLWLVGGGLGIAIVEPSLWNGLLLTFLIAVLSIALSFPLGVLLALGRQSSMPVVKWCCIIYIEVIRGLPLIGILFMAQVMLPLVLPTGMRVDRILRAIAGFVFFSAAYLAENVRGGLQSIPRGQTEAAKALGLSTPLIMLFIVLPQALKAVIPAIVGQFIGLFKDTSLVSIVGLVDLMGISRSILAQPNFLGRYAEVYLFIALIYWMFCYSMSVGSRNLEKSLQRN